MSRPLVIVESPAKAKTVARHLGDGYDVRASVGHIADLPTKGLGVDVDNGFKPQWELTQRGKDVVKELRSLLKDASELYLATDEDREGEIISWHLLQHLKPKVPVKRMVFHEITRSAITRRRGQPSPGRRGPGRRGRDPPHPRPPGTAGRCHRSCGARSTGDWPPAGCRARPPVSSSSGSGSGWRSSPPSYWDIEALLATDPAFTATLVGVDGTKVATGKDFGDDGQTKGQVVVLDEERANALAEGLAGRDLEVRSVEERPYTSSPKPPFMTSTLQQEGGRKLRLSAQQVMRVAQGLYERGFITYMRTDSVTLSDEALTAVRATVASTYGDRFLSPGPRRYTTKVKNAQEAHEAIRPSTPLRPPDQVVGRAARARPRPLPPDLAAHAGLADGRRHRHDGERAARRGERDTRGQHRLRVRRQRDDHHLPRLPAGVRRIHATTAPAPTPSARRCSPRSPSGRPSRSSR